MVSGSGLRFERESSFLILGGSETYSPLKSKSHNRRKADPKSLTQYYGHSRYCKEKLSSFCENTNKSSMMQTMYGQRDAGFFGYSHFTGGFPGGQAGECDWIIAEIGGCGDRRLKLVCGCPNVAYLYFFLNRICQGELITIYLTKLASRR